MGATSDSRILGALPPRASEREGFRELKGEIDREKGREEKGER